MLHYTFRWNTKTVRLSYSLEPTARGLQFVLDDVCATSLAAVEAVPDWKIDLEASAAASQHGARYMSAIA